MSKKFYVTDCEGPLSINDNAYEICDYFINDGANFFSILSNYDDILAQQNEDYLAGTTLKFIVPFLKAHDLTNEDIIDYSEDNIFLLNGALDMIKYVQDMMPFYIVSTSYVQYIKALCNYTGFIFENTYSTQLDLNNYNLAYDEQDKLFEIYDNILFDSSFENIDHIFKNTISNMDVSNLMNSINPVGGIGKRNAILDIINKNNYEPYNLMYSGDSITDKEALEYTKDNDGLSISFNGNEFSIDSAEISIASENNLILGVLAEIFNNKSKEGVYDFIHNYHEDPLESILSSSNNKGLIQDLLLNKPSIDIVNDNNKKELINTSKIVRNKVRGINISNLG
ncbi:MAG: hypothetical protein E7Z84_05520 [Methanosphaera stadtmanae]|nr:hypothetical protein [Methanosphaera stadtmanae]